ncbi:hypothetical protein KUV57_13620 [Epibacterium sp. DP7N7-1]|nr:hypothetical protein [Epibacterium sp. DP7N7-1]
MKPEHFPIHEQLTYTDGFCETFAAALLGHYGPQLRAVELVVTDPRYAARMDYPDDSRIAVHVFCLDSAGCAIDAEGRRTIDELMKSFGIGSGYRHEISSKTPDAEGPSGGWNALLHARELISSHGWPDQPERIPAADGRLSRNFARARREQEAVRAERKATAEVGPEI